MVTRTQVSERYWRTLFNLDLANSEVGDYVTSSEIIRTVFHIGNKNSAWNVQPTKTVEEIRQEIIIPRQDYKEWFGIPTPAIGDKIKILNPDTLEVEETYRLDDMTNQNRWMTSYSAVLEVPKKKGVNT